VRIACNGLIDRDAPKAQHSTTTIRREAHAPAYPEVTFLFFPHFLTRWPRAKHDVVSLPRRQFAPLCTDDGRPLPPFPPHQIGCGGVVFSAPARYAPYPLLHPCI
jgi:hypothetical protein